MKYFGIYFDEGAVIEGDKGDYGHYRQRQRKNIYQVLPPQCIRFLLLKSDGIPTYHFAHVVDDHLKQACHFISMYFDETYKVEDEFPTSVSIVDRKLFLMKYLEYINFHENKEYLV